MNLTDLRSTLLAAILVANVGAAFAQQTAPFSVNGSPSDFNLTFRANGTFVSKGLTGVSYAYSLDPADQAAGIRMLWFAPKGALRAGRTHLPSHTPIGDYSVALGHVTFATEFASTALGSLTWATGSDSLATGRGTSASGSAAASFGYGTWAGGETAFAQGYQTAAAAYASAAFGRFNVGGGNPTAWVATDPLFEIGNGTTVWTYDEGNDEWYDVVHPSNALTIYKNGSARFQGVVTVAPGGDIPMYTGN